MTETFDHRIVYRDKERVEQMICSVCGASPVIEWQENPFQTFGGWTIMIPAQILCPNGAHETTMDVFNAVRQEEIKVRNQRIAEEQLPQKGHKRWVKSSQL